MLVENVLRLKCANAYLIIKKTIFANEQLSFLYV